MRMRLRPVHLQARAGELLASDEPTHAMHGLAALPSCDHGTRPKVQSR